MRKYSRIVTTVGIKGGPSDGYKIRLIASKLGHVLVLLHRRLSTYGILLVIWLRVNVIGPLGEVFN